MPNVRDRRRGARVGLERVARPNPRVVAAVEQAHVVDTGVAQDQRCTAGGDLAGSTPRPLLVRVALRVAAVEDDGRVVRDSERAHGETELLRRPALPVDGILELVGVEVERPRKVPFRVLLGDAEVDVEEQEASGRRRLRSVAVEHLGEPVAVHEPVVVRETLDGQSLVAGPLGPPGLVDAHPLVVELGEPGSHGRNVCGVAVEDDLLVGDDTFLEQKPCDLGVVDARQPRAGKRDGSGNVATSSFAQPPAVVRVERTNVDDGQAGIREARAQLGGGNGQAGVDIGTALSKRVHVAISCDDPGRRVRQRKAPLVEVPAGSYSH